MIAICFALALLNAKKHGRKFEILQRAILFQGCARLVFDIALLVLDRTLDFKDIFTKVCETYTQKEDNVSWRPLVLGFISFFIFYGEDLFKFLVSSLAVLCAWLISSFSVCKRKEDAEVIHLYLWLVLSLLLLVFDIASTIFWSLKVDEILENVLIQVYSLETNSLYHFGLSVFPIYFTRGFWQIFNIIAMKYIYERTNKLKKAEKRVSAFLASSGKNSEYGSVYDNPQINTYDEIPYASAPERLQQWPSSPTYEETPSPPPSYHRYSYADDSFNQQLQSTLAIPRVNAVTSVHEHSSSSGDSSDINYSSRSTMSLYSNPAYKPQDPSHSDEKPSPLFVAEPIPRVTTTDRSTLLAKYLAENLEPPTDYEGGSDNVSYSSK